MGVIHWYSDTQPMGVIHWYSDTQTNGGYSLHPAIFSCADASNLASSL